MVNRLRKGRRKERQVKKWMEDMGYLVFKPTWNKWKKNKDIFGFFDLFCIQKDRPTVYVQVKTRDPSKKLKNEIKEFCKKKFGDNYSTAWIVVKPDYHDPEMEILYP